MFASPEIKNAQIGSVLNLIKAIAYNFGATLRYIANKINITADKIATMPK